MAGLVGVFTGGVLGDHRHHAQGRAVQVVLVVQAGRAGAQPFQRLQRREPPGALAGEVGDLVDALTRHRPQQWEQGAHGLADTGGRLGQQAAAAGRRAVHRLGQATLPGAERPRRKRQLQQRRVPRLAVQRLLPGPAQERGAALLKGLRQFGGAEDLAQHHLGLAVDIEIDQRQRQLGQAAGPAEQRAIGLQLRPVQVATVLGDLVGVAAQGLDLLQAAAAGVVTVGPPAYPQRAALALQHQLGLVVGAAARCHGELALDALQRGGRGREAPVQVTPLGGELAQRTHRHGVGPARYRRLGGHRVARLSRRRPWRARDIGGKRGAGHGRHCRDDPGMALAARAQRAFAAPGWRCYGFAAR